MEAGIQGSFSSYCLQTRYRIQTCITGSPPQSDP